VAVTDAYERSCALTRERTLPILDLGYVTIATDGKFEVGNRLREDFENGQHYYQMHGQSLWLPNDPRSQPSRKALEWHQSNRFLG